VRVHDPDGLALVDVGRRDEQPEDHEPDDADDRGDAEDPSEGRAGDTVARDS